MTTKVKIYENPVILACIGLTFLVLALIDWSLPLCLAGIIILYMSAMVADHQELTTSHIGLEVKVDALEGRLSTAFDLIESQQAQILRQKDQIQTLRKHNRDGTPWPTSEGGKKL